MPKKRSKKPKKASKKDKAKYIYTLYILIIGIFFANIVIDVVSDDTEYTWQGCGDWCGAEDCCAEECHDCGGGACISEEDDDDDDTEDTNTTNETTPAAGSNCSTDTLTASASVSGELLTYTYTVVSCSAGQSASVYLKGTNSTNTSAGNVIKKYLRQGRTLGEYGSVSGSGQELSSQGYTEICVELGSTTECG